MPGQVLACSCLPLIALPSSCPVLPVLGDLEPLQESSPDPPPPASPHSKIFTPASKTPSQKQDLPFSSILAPLGHHVGRREAQGAPRVAPGGLASLHHGARSLPKRRFQNLKRSFWGAPYAKPKRNHIPPLSRPEPKRSLSAPLGTPLAAVGVFRDALGSSVRATLAPEASRNGVSKFCRRQKRRPKTTPGLGPLSLT